MTLRIHILLVGLFFLSALTEFSAQKQLNHWWLGNNLEMEWDCSGNYTFNSTNNPTLC